MVVLVQILQLQSRRWSMRWAGSKQQGGSLFGRSGPAAHNTVQFPQRKRSAHCSLELKLKYYYASVCVPHKLSSLLASPFLTESGPGLKRFKFVSLLTATIISASGTYWSSAPLLWCQHRAQVWYSPIIQWQLDTKKWDLSSIYMVWIQNCDRKNQDLPAQ